MNEEKKQNRHDQIIMFLISVCLHILIITLLYFCIPDMLSLEPTTDTSMHQMPDDNEFVKRTARSAPVIFMEDRPADTPPEKDQSEQQEDDSQDAPDDAHEQEEPIKEQKKDSNNQDDLDASSDKPVLITQTFEHAPEQMQKLRNRRRRLTMADLVSGFMRHLKDPGDAAFDVESDKIGNPTETQLKHERFIQKIFSCLQVSARFVGMQPPTKEEMRLGVAIVLDRNGRLKQAEIVQTSGNPALDEYALQVIRQAANSFPPVPTYLEGNPYILPFTWIFTRF